MHETYVGRSIALVWVVSFLFIVSYAVGAVSGLGPMLYMLVAGFYTAVIVTAVCLYALPICKYSLYASCDSAVNNLAVNFKL